jgi:hypothetical protein
MTRKADDRRISNADRSRGLPAHILVTFTLCLAACLGIECAAPRMLDAGKEPPPASGPATIAKGELAVPPLELKVSLLRAEVIAGEAIALTVTVHNRGDAAIRVHSSESQSPFVFQLLPIEAGRAGYTLSQHQYQVVISGGDPPPPYTPPMEDLAPGAEVVHTCDPARYATEPILSGRYRLVAHYALGDQEFASPPVELAIVVPRVETFAGLVGPVTNSLALAFSHRTADGSVALFQRESPPGKPDLGVALRCQESGPNSRITGVAQAAELGEMSGRRWIAWLEGERIGALMAGMTRRSANLEPVPAGLSSPRLLPVGRKHDDGRAVFLVAGIEGGKPRVREFTFTVKEPPTVRTLDLGGATVPEHLLARYQPDGSDAQVTLVWAETAGGAVAIYRRSYPAGDPGAGGERELLLKRPGSLLAMELLPVGGESVDVLFGPVGTSGKYSYLRIPLPGAKPAVERLFDGPGGKVDGWAIAGPQADGFAVIAKVGERLIWSRIEPGEGWHLIASGSGQATYMSLFALGDRRLWAAWYDPQSGIRYQPLPR